MDPDTPSDIAMPLSLKVFGILAFVVILLIAVMLLMGGPGAHGPGRHIG